MDRLDEQYISEIFSEWYMNVLEADFAKNDYPPCLLKAKIENFLMELNKTYRTDPDIYYRAETLLSRLGEQKDNG